MNRIDPHPQPVPPPADPAVTTLDPPTTPDPAPTQDRAAAVHLLSRASVLVIGDVMLDRYVYGQVTRISPEAPSRSSASTARSPIPVAPATSCATSPHSAPRSRWSPSSATTRPAPT